MHACYSANVWIEYYYRYIYSSCMHAAVMDDNLAY